MYISVCVCVCVCEHSLKTIFVNFVTTNDAVF